MDTIIDLALARMMIAELQSLGFEKIRLVDLIAYLIPVCEDKTDASFEAAI